MSFHPFGKYQLQRPWRVRNDARRRRRERIRGRYGLYASCIPLSLVLMFLFVWLLETPLIVITAQKWHKMSLRWFSEPSGLVTAGSLLNGEDGAEWIVGVSDEQPGVYILKVYPQRGLGRFLPGRSRNAGLPAFSLLPVGRSLTETFVYDYLPFSEDIRDLEGIAYDPRDSTYYALTSHRQGGDGGEKARQILRFKLVREGTRNPEFRIESESRLKDLASTSAGNLPSVINQIVDSTATITAEVWEQPKSKLYGLELEGIAVGHDTSSIYLGVKRPLSGRNAILLKYYPRRSEDQPVLVATALPLDGSGIRDLAYDHCSNSLLVLAHSAEVRTGDGWKSRPGESRLYVFPQSELNRPLPQFTRRIDLDSIAGVAEGIAVLPRRDRLEVIIASEGTREDRAEGIRASQPELTAVRDILTFKKPCLPDTSPPRARG